jgi:hypothetical protein
MPMPFTLPSSKTVKLAVSAICSGMLILVIVCLLWKWQDDLAVLCTVLGTAIGWLVGTLISPYGSEARQFETFGKVISAFVTGFLLSKIDTIFTLLSRDDYHNLITNPHVVRRFLVAVTSCLLAMMVTFIARQYFFNPPTRLISPP